MKLSVIIITKDRPEMLKRCLQSLEAQTVMPDEVVIIDTGSSPGSSRVVEEFTEKINIVYIWETFSSIPASRNMGIRVSKGDILTFVDDDCLVDNVWAEKVLSYNRVYSDVPVLQHNTVFNKGGQLIEEAQIAGYYFYLKQRFPQVVEDGDPVFIPRTYNSFISFKRDSIDRFDIKFDERFPRLSDKNLSVSLQKEGCRVLYVSDIIVYHEYKCPTLRDMYDRYYIIGRMDAYIRKAYGDFQPSPGYGYFAQLIKTFVGQNRPVKERAVLIFIHLVRAVAYTFGRTSSIFKRGINCCGKEVK